MGFCARNHLDYESCLLWGNLNIGNKDIAGRKCEEKRNQSYSGISTKST